MGEGLKVDSDNEKRKVYVGRSLCTLIGSTCLETRLSDRVSTPNYETPMAEL